MIEFATEPGNNMLRLARLLRFVGKTDHQAFYYFRDSGRFFKVTIKEIDESEYKP